MENVSPPLIIVFFLIGLILALLFRSRLKSRRSKPNAPSPQSETLNGQSITPVWETASLLNISSKMSADLEEVADRTDEVLSKAITEFENWLDTKSMPYVGLTPKRMPPPSEIASRLGGPAVLPENADWPVDKTGKAMLMLAQINMEQIKGLSEFPDVGVLQYFIASDDVFGLDFDTPLASDHKVLWHPDVSKLTKVLPQPLDYKEDMTPFMKRGVFEDGINLAPAQVAQQRPEWGVWFLDERMEEVYEISGGEDAMEALFEAMDYHAHRVGGHPSFTQQDPRHHNDLSDYTRILLQVGYDDDLMFGDSGECTFFITEADLKARRFDRVLYNWDCC